MTGKIRLVAGHVASLVWVAVRTFVVTLLLLTLAGIGLAGLSFFFLRGEHWLYGVGAVVLAVVEAVVLGVVLGGKRALVMALAHGLRSLRLGATLVRLLFERMLGVVEGEEVGERGRRIVRGLERLPLAQADQLLSGAIRDVAGDGQEGGWLRRKIQARLLDLVGKYTLARFRQEGARHGGVDLVAVKEELEGTVDEMVVRKVLSGLRVWTWSVIVGLPVLVAVQTVVLLLLSRWGE
jgi:hypothetical protein